MRRQKQRKSTTLDKDWKGHLMNIAKKVNFLINIPFALRDFLAMGN